MIPGELAGGLNGKSKKSGEIFPRREVNVADKNDKRGKADILNDSPLIPQLFNLKSDQAEIKKSDRQQERVISKILSSWESQRRCKQFIQAVC